MQNHLQIPRDRNLLLQATTLVTRALVIPAGLDAVLSATSNDSGADAPSTESSEPNSSPSDALDGVRMPALTTKAQGLREVLEEAIRESLPADCIILSGGLDTCIIAEVAAEMAVQSTKDSITASGRNDAEAIKGSDVLLDEPAKEDFTFHWGSKPMKQAEGNGETKRIEEHARTSVHPHSNTSLTTPSSTGNKRASESSGFDAQTPGLLHNPLSAPGQSGPNRQTKPPDESGNGSHYTNSERPKSQQKFKGALTVLTGEHATDRPYAAEIARRCGLQHTVVGGIGFLRIVSLWTRLSGVGSLSTSAKEWQTLSWTPVNPTFSKLGQRMETSCGSESSDSGTVYFDFENRQLFAVE